MELENAVRDWVEQLIGGIVENVEHQGRWRPQFFVDVRLPDDSVVPLVLRYERDPEYVDLSAFLSRFDVAHEAAVLQALQDTDVKVPHLYGFDEKVRVIAMERVNGTNELVEDTDDSKGVLDDFIANLVALHALTPQSMPAVQTIPTSPEQLALDGLFRYMETDYGLARDLIGPEPLLDFAVWWLHNNIPRGRTEACWVQGDTGPGQFMHDGSGITALIDWELSHVGDPISDLGVMRMRNMLYPVGELANVFQRYQELSGRTIERSTLCYYTVLAMVLSPLGLSPRIQFPDAAVPSMLPSFGWDVTLRRGLTDALCEAHGVRVEGPDLPVATDEGEPARSDLHRYLVDHLAGNCLPIATDDWDVFLVRGGVAIAQALERERRFGPGLEAADIADMRQVLGSTPPSREAGLHALKEIVDRGPDRKALELLWLFTRMQRRREFIWEPLMLAQKSEPFEWLYAAERLVTVGDHGPDPVDRA
ncbi:phosphotransferase [Gordonia sp. NPDC058843]|uniref:phosphotransferase n=1 Tax=Gordonia sp. NPDC058843 TaxID=3346648 RepID=UPI0036B0E104